MSEFIEILGAREHNLKNIDVKIPRNQLVVITGISGSGKSSLAFDTLYAEGQRRYMESFSAYARSFLGNMQRPEVDKIEGLSPVIAIEQKTTSRNPRSTVGTITEIYDFLRLLFARAGEAYSYITGEKMIRQSEDQIINTILEKYNQQKITLLAPIVRGRKGHYKELFVQIQKMGYTKARIDGKIEEIKPKMQLDRYKIHDIEIVIDRIIVDASERFRLAQSIQKALKEGKGMVFIQLEDEHVAPFSKYLMCPTSGISYDEPAPNMFSFNSAYGACPTCSGLGIIEEYTEESILPNPNLNIKNGAIAPLGIYRDIAIFHDIAAVLKYYKLTLSKPITEFSREAIESLLYGTAAQNAINKKKSDWQEKLPPFEGVIGYLKKFSQSDSDKIRDWASEYLVEKTCPDCEGARLKKESLHFRIADKNIAQLAQMEIKELTLWFIDIEKRLSKKQNAIATEILKEIRKRIGFLIEIGLDYLSLNRPMRTLSGGEAQRIRLATQIGTQLVGVLYILDEPSIGLHQRDNVKLIQSLKNLTSLGNSVLVVEHDKDIMLEADYLVDIGPGAGIHGGSIIGQGTPKNFLKNNSVTANYLNGKVKIAVPATRRQGNDLAITLTGATGHNLKNVTLNIPLGKMIGVTGVSGSGKSSLIHETLFPILNKHFFNAKKDPLAYASIEGLKNIDKVIEIDQEPIGRTPRSNPATYTGVFTLIRTLFAVLPEAKIRGYQAGRFSFNVKGGRCETCEGGGMKVIEMDFLPDVHVECETCKGKRYNRETLEVRFKGKSIADVLNMTVDQGVDFFENQPSIVRKIKTLQDVGLGYLTLGQQATTLSGGEAQRVKLATELSKRDTGKTLYILDEPTTGLHFQDIGHLLDVLNKLVDKGNTVLIIEHNLDVIKSCDYVIDLGPEGGEKGGDIIAEGAPEDIVDIKESHTARFLKLELEDK